MLQSVIMCLQFLLIWASSLVFRLSFITLIAFKSIIYFVDYSTVQVYVSSCLDSGSVVFGSIISQKWCCALFNASYQEAFVFLNNFLVFQLQLIDIQYYISLRCTAQRLHIYITCKVIASITLGPIGDTIPSYYNITDCIHIILGGI